MGIASREELEAAAKQFDEFAAKFAQLKVKKARLAAIVATKMEEASLWMAKLLREEDDE